jgi:hypothetical protein
VGRRESSGSSMICCGLIIARLYRADWLEGNWSAVDRRGD